MTAPDAGAVPAPGSDAAIKAGCTCPVMQSLYWRGATKYKIGKNWTPWVDGDCPIHTPKKLGVLLPDPLDNPTMRPRTDADTGGRDVD